MTRRPSAPPTRPGSAMAASSEAMTGRGQTHGEQAVHAIVAPVATVDHVRGDPLGPVIIEYGDYECRTQEWHFVRSSGCSGARGMRSVSSSGIFR
jgi:hypothetical protein